MSATAITTGDREFFKSDFAHLVAEAFMPKVLINKTVSQLVEVYRPIATLLATGRFSKFSEKKIHKCLRDLQIIILHQMKCLGNRHEVLSGITTSIETNGLSFNQTRRALINPMHCSSYIEHICREDLGIREERILDFVALGANVNLSNPHSKETPIFWIKSLRILEIFVRKGADINAKDWADCTVIHRRAGLPLLKKCIELGADVNMRSKSGSTPLHHLFSLTEERTEIAELFIQNGARVNELDNEGLTPMDVVHNREIREVFVRNGGRHATSFEKRFNSINMRRAKMVMVATVVVVILCAVILANYDR